jgi:hypothetical protein
VIISPVVENCAKISGINILAESHMSHLSLMFTKWSFFQSVNNMVSFHSHSFIMKLIVNPMYYDDKIQI